MQSLADRLRWDLSETRLPSLPRTYRVVPLPSSRINFIIMSRNEGLQGCLGQPFGRFPTADRHAAVTVVDVKDAGAINRNLSLLRRMMNLARREGKSVQFPYFPMLKENNVRKGFLTPRNSQNCVTRCPNICVR